MLGGMNRTLEHAAAWVAAHPTIQLLLGVAAVLLAAWVIHLGLRRFLIRGIDGLVRRSSVSWDDALQESRVFQRIVLVVPVIIIWQGMALIPEIPDNLVDLLQRLAVSTILLIGMLTLNAFLSALNVIYARNAGEELSAIKGYLEIAQIMVVIVAAILILAVLLDRSPMVFLGGLGAMTAVLLVVFRDTLLGLVASLQIAANDMVRIGDWIEMPSAGADGDVIDIALHTMKVQNFDKTVVTIPTYKLIQESFKNWRGMSESGGRRIKRSLWFDVNTVRFLSPAEEEQLGKYLLLRAYIEEKRNAIASYNQEPGRDPKVMADIRRLTNIGTLRAYIESYLRNHPSIRQDMTLMVRQLQPASDGIPLEIYCFTATTEWAEYEGIQADIFDHILAMTSEFGLRIFQNESDYAQAVATGSAEEMPKPSGAHS
jgi:miniconductance mechanosensitive channel